MDGSRKSIIFIVLFLSIILLLSCSDDDADFIPLDDICRSENMAGEWETIVTRTSIFANDSSSNPSQAPSTKFVLEINGQGLYYDLPTQPSLILWSYQCLPDVFTFSQNLSLSDTTYSNFDLYDVKTLQITTNELDYKVMIDTVLHRRGGELVREASIWEFIKL